jgi:hypothetical protein
MEAYAVIRADNELKLKTAINDLKKHGKLEFSNIPKQLPPDFADQLLIEVMNTDLKKHCNVAAIIGLNSSAGAAIDALRKIHPPAHIIIVSNRYEIFSELDEMVEELPEIDISVISVQMDWES